MNKAREFGTARQMTNTPQSPLWLWWWLWSKPITHPVTKTNSQTFLKSVQEKTTKRQQHAKNKKKHINFFVFVFLYTVNLYHLPRFKLYQDKEKKKEPIKGSEGKRSGASTTLFINKGVCETTRRLYNKRRTIEKPNQISTKFFSQNW